MEGYCRNGIHYIGDKSTCGKCDLVEVMRTKERLYYGARDANLLAEWLRDDAADV